MRNKLAFASLILLLTLPSIASAEVSKQDPFATIGEDFLVVAKESYNPELYVLFDNTTIYIDIEDDGVWEEKVVRNAGQKYTVSIPTQPLFYGTRIHTDKPVLYWQRMNSWIQEVVPPISSLRSEYYAFDGRWYAVVVENATIYVDNNDDGTIDNTIDATKLRRVSVPVNNFARVFSDKPFYLYYSSNTFAGQKGTDFYIQWNELNRIIVLENNTVLKIDRNNDGYYDEEHTLNKGVVTNFAGFTLANGAHIWTDKPIVIFCKRGGYGQIYYVPPSNMLGNDAWSPDSNNYYRITGLFGEETGLYVNTTYYIDKATENDLIPNAVSTVNKNEYKGLPNLGRVHVWGNMPFCLSYYYSYYYYRIPYSSISVTTYGTQKVLGANELTEIYVRVFNPFANTTATNLSLTIPIPLNFSLPNGNSLEFTIEKRFLRNDTVISSDTVTLTPTIEENYIFKINKSVTSLLNSLEPMTYLDIRYSVVTPSEYGSYRFDPVSLKYDALTWNMPQ